MRLTPILNSLQTPPIAPNLVFPPTAPAPRSTIIDFNLSNILYQIESLREIGGTAGISIGIARQGRSILEHQIGFADAEQRMVANSSTRYPLGSLTKGFVAVTVAQLVGDGVLDWDAPIVEYMPELVFQFDESLAHRLTLRDLLSHNTGLARVDALWLGADGEVVIPDKNATIPVCAALRPVYPLRSKWLYNNWMYALAGEVIERVANISWGKVLSRTVLERAGLRQTSVLRGDVDKSLAKMNDLTLTDDVLMSAAGGVRSTVHDMLRWGDVLLASLRDDGNTSLTPSIQLPVDTVFSGHSFMRRSAASDELYGLGFAKVHTPARFGRTGFNPGLVGEEGMPLIGSRNHHPNDEGGRGVEGGRLVFYHNGALPGYNHCFMLIPSLKMVIVVLTNSISHGDIADWVAQTLLQAVLPEVAGNKDTEQDLLGPEERAAEAWRGTYDNISEVLDAERVIGTLEPRHEELVGRYWHEDTGALFLEVYQDYDDSADDEGVGGGHGGTGVPKLKFNINDKKSQTRDLTHYHFDVFSFLPPDADERARRGLFHYGPRAWLLAFEKGDGGEDEGDNREGDMKSVRWVLDEEAPAGGEVFVRRDWELLGY
ncbi:beta-lactamase/transpeptidase-like protein [Xylariaceae sp. FL0255]|nr:beta-lactamase/transpeptidase-like protein [Xylariaceae sp. FL0255]